MVSSEEKENSRIIRAAGVVGTATLGSRILGFIRDMVTAFFFGTTDAADAFFMAFTIPNLLRRLFAEGTMTVSFVPVFSDYLVNKGKEEAFKVARITMTLLTLFLMATVLAGILFSPQIIAVFAPGFKGDPEKWELTIYLTRLMFPYILFISLTSLAMGILNSMGHFLAPASAPMLLNISMIGAMFFISPFLEVPILGLALGVIIGGVLQLILQIPILRKKGLSLRPNFNFSHPAVKTIFRLMLPAIFGASIYQLNVVVIRLLASLLPQGSVSYLYYADRLAQFPLGIFAVAIGTAILPSMSRMAALNKMDELKETLTDALKMTLYITVPAAVGLMVLRLPIISLIFFRGEFDFKSVEYTAEALLFFAVGLPFVSAVRVVANAFYAIKDTLTPVKVGAVSIIVNILLSVILMEPLGVSGLALAVSLSAFLNLFFLVTIFYRRIGRMGIEKLAVSLLRIGVGSAIMGLAAWFVASMIRWDMVGGTIEKILILLVAVIVGVVIYAFSTYLLGSHEFKAIIGPFIEKVRGR